MELEDKLRIQTKLIQDLNQKNEELKKQLSEAEVKLALSTVSYDETLEQARQIIIAGQQAEDEYKKATQEARDIKHEYEECLKEIYKLKNKYKDLVDNVIKQVK